MVPSLTVLTVTTVTALGLTAAAVVGPAKMQHGRVCRANLSRSKSCGYEQTWERHVCSSRRRPPICMKAMAEATGQHEPTLLLTATPPRTIALMVEPSPFTHISGYSNRFLELLKYLKKAGDDVHIVTTDDKEDAPTEILGYPITTTTGFRFHLYNHIVLSFDSDLKGWGVVEQCKPDVLHCTSPGFIVLAALLYARLFRVPLVFSYHTHLPLYARSYIGTIPFAEDLCWSFLKFVHNRADLTLCTSPQMQEELEGAGIERVEVWKKGIDTDTFNPRFKDADMRSQLTDGHPEDPLLIYIGRLGIEKRLQDLRAVIDLVPNARLAFVGTGPDEDLIQEAFAGTKTKFMGVMRGEQLSRAFASADVFLMPSDSETLGFVVLESMASGVPVIGARAGGIPDIIQDGVTGYLVEPGDTASWVSRVKTLLEDKPLYNQMRLAARAETEKWSWEAATSYLRNVQYKKAINNFRYRAFKGWGLPRTRSKFRSLIVQVKRLLMAIKTALLTPQPYY